MVRFQVPFARPAEDMITNHAGFELMGTAHPDKHATFKRGHSALIPFADHGCRPIFHLVNHRAKDVPHTNGRLPSFSEGKSGTAPYSILPFQYRAATFLILKKEPS
jgi:hypothetical protein